MTSINAHLPIRPRPRTNELASGYLVRVAEGNGYSGPRELLRSIGQNRFLREHGICTALLMKKSELASLFGPFRFNRMSEVESMRNLRSDDFNHHSMRWCPACISESAHLHGEWGLKLCCACVTHRVMLCDQCPSCGALQRLERSELCRCVCGYSLTRAKTYTVAKPLLDLHQILHDSILAKNMAMSMAAWVRLVKYLGPFDTNPLERTPGQVAGMHRLSVAVALTSGAANILTNWPVNFVALLGRIREALPTATHIGEAFGPLYRILYRDLHDPAFTFLRNEFEAYLHENWFGLLGRRNRRLKLETVDSHAHKPVDTVAHLAGISSTMMRHFVKTGMITGNVVHHPSGRITWAISTDAAAIAAKYVSGGSTLRMSALNLGLPRHRVRELIDAGLIRQSINPRQAGAAAWLLSNADIDLLAAVGSQTRSIAETADRLVSISSILKAWRLRDSEFPALMRSLLSGEINVYGRAPDKIGISGTLLAADEVRTWLIRLRVRTEAWFSIDGAAIQLGIKQQVAYELATRGLLHTIREEKNGKTSLRIPHEAILEFQRHYVSLIEIAAYQGRSSRKVLVTIFASAVCGPKIDGARQYFFRREDVAKLLLASVVEESDLRS